MIWEIFSSVYLSCMWLIWSYPSQSLIKIDRLLSTCHSKVSVNFFIRPARMKAGWTQTFLLIFMFHCWWTVPKTLSINVCHKSLTHSYTWEKNNNSFNACCEIFATTSKIADCQLLNLAGWGYGFKLNASKPNEVWSCFHLSLVILLAYLQWVWKLSNLYFI